MPRIRKGFDPHKNREGAPAAGPIYFQDVASFAKYVGDVHAEMVRRGAPRLPAAKWLLTRLAGVTRSFMHKTPVGTVAVKLMDEAVYQAAFDVEPKA